MTADQMIRALWRATADAGGATMARDGTVPTAGYAVGATPGTAVVVPDTAGYRSFARAVKRVLREHPAPYIGTWRHAGAVHVDPVIVVSSRRAARREARAHDQVAYHGLRAAITYSTEGG